MKRTITSYAFMVITAMLFTVFGLGRNIVSGQYPVSSYSFSQTSGTYTPITGGTLISSTIDDWWGSDEITLTPGFNFCGTVYTTAYMSTTGNITLGGSSAVVSTQAIQNSTGNLLCPFNSELEGSTVTGADPNLRYELVGNEHVFQWKDARRWNQNNERFSFQARLNTVTGTITYVYYVDTVGTATGNQPIVGISTSSSTGNWQTRLVANSQGTSWATSVDGTSITSICRFTSGNNNARQPDDGQTYVYSPPPSCSTVSTLPTAGTSSIFPLSVCLSGNVTINLAPNTPMPYVTGITYKWQSSTNGSLWVDIPGAITNGPSYTTTTPITAPLYFRGVMLCEGTMSYEGAASTQLIINNPGSVTGIPGTRCGPGDVDLGATPTGTAGVNWYANAIGGAPLGSGTSFNTNYITATTNFYAAAAEGLVPTTAVVAEDPNIPWGTNGGSMPFGWDMIHTGQFIVTAAELAAAGFSAGTIQSVGFDLLAGGSGDYDNFTIKVASVPSGTTMDLWYSLASAPALFGPQTVTPVPSSINTYPLTTGVVWNGVDDILIQTCYSNANWPNNAYSVRYNGNWDDPVVGRSSGWNTVDCDNVGDDWSTTQKPNVILRIDAPCEGPRVAVTATVTPGPAFAIDNPDVVCNDAIGDIHVTSPLSNYTTYHWTPITDLYTNSAATTAYTTGGNSSQLYMKSTTVGIHTYAVAASGGAGGCTAADTARIWVQPGTVTIKAIPDTICVTGTSTLKLVPNTGYAANSIQWQESSNGTLWSNINGANSSEYTTAVLSAPMQFKYYRALIKSDVTTPCLVPEIQIVIADPTLESTKDSFNCGPGTVTLEATTDGVSNVKWYNSPTASQPVGAGSPFTTPFLGATTTYYVAASTGTPQPADTFVNGGTDLSMWDQSLPFYVSNWGTSINKQQTIIPASAMANAGFSAGFITSIGYDIGSAGDPLEDMKISLKNSANTGFPVSWPSFFETGMEEVYTNPSYQLVSDQLNVINFQNPFYWNGVDNIIVEECHANANTGNGNEVRYTWMSTGKSVYCNANNPNNCSAPPANSIQPGGAVPKMWIGMKGACESNRIEVTAYIHPKPAVDLGTDINRCVDEGEALVLDAGVQPNSPEFHWDNNTTSQVRAVTAPGTYDVSVTNSFGCVGSDTINVILRANPVVDLGNDTTVCNGAVLTLDADGDGIQYFWNTGATSQVISATTEGSYNVFVTNAEGCVKADTILITMDGELPTIQGVNVTNNGQYTFQFSAVNPQNVIGYDWDFGDNSPHVYEASPIHTYADDGNYIVVLHLSSSCGFMSDSSSAHIVGINQLNIDKNELTVYPNPTRETATILNRGGLKMEHVEVYNVLGQVVYKSKVDSKDKHTLQLGGFASGVYTIQVYTDKGTVARKLEILK